MLVKLVTTSQIDSSYRDELMFDVDEISIGRLTDNEVTLPDRELVVGRKHAKIFTGGEFAYVVDGGSRNGTLLNDVKLVTGKKYQLRSGDTLSIGHFVLDFQVLESSPATKQPRTVDGAGTDVQQAYVNPFESYVKKMNVLIQQLKATYAIASPEHRDVLLSESLDRELAPHKGDDVGNLISLALGNYRPDARTPEVIVKEVERPQQEMASYLPYSDPNLVSRDEWVRQINAVITENKEAQFMQRMAIVDDVLLRAMDKLIKIPAQFRAEFIGHSFMPHGSRFPFDTCTVHELKAYLYDRNISYDELKNRLLTFENAVEQVLYHEVAMLDGYKQGVKYGAHMMLERLEPNSVKQRALQEGSEMRTLGVFSNSKWLQAIKVAHQEFLGEDKGMLEKNVYRPGFIRGYLEKYESFK